MNETFKILPKRKGEKFTFRTTIKIVSISILVLSIGSSMFLSSYIDNPAFAAQLPGTPIDYVTWVKTTETSNFNTPDDPSDDSIDYVPNPGYTGPDTIIYEICDATLPLPDCDQATVNVTIDPVTSIVKVASTQPQSSTMATIPTAVDDNALMIVDTWINIKVLKNDDFGTDGPGNGPITIVTGPTNGTARVNDGPRSPDPSGLAYLVDHPNAAYTDNLLISDSEVDEIAPPNLAAYTGVNLFITDLLGSLSSTLTTYDPTHIPPVTFSLEPSGAAYNPINDFLYFADDRKRMIYELNPGSDGDYNTSDDIVRNIDTLAFNNGSLDPSGAAFDHTRGNGHLFISDDDGEEIYDINLGPNGVLDGSDALTHFDTSSIGIRRPEGVEFNPDNCTLFILSSLTSDHLIAETTIDGHLLRYLDIGLLDGGVHARVPAGLAYAPASSDPEANNLFLVARGIDNNAGQNPDPLENDGKMFEISFDNNAPPFVDAGQNDSTDLSEAVSLDGTVTDGCSPGLDGVTTSWSVVSGPGPVQFGNPNAIDTTASFSKFGDYILKLSADDGGAHIASDEVTITVGPKLAILLPIIFSNP
jgi:hypothetical protein